MNLRRWSIYIVLVLIGLTMTIAPALTGDFEELVAGVGFAVYAVMGGLVIGRRDGHTTGWLLVLVGLSIVFANGFSSWPGMSPGTAAWVESWSWTVVFALYALLAWTFPSGRLPGVVLGRVVVWALVVLVAVAPFTETLGGTSISTGTPNPMGFIPGWLSWVSPIGTLMVLLGGAVSLLVRRRYAGPVERAQLTWVVFALALLATAVVATFVFIIASIAVGAGDPGDDAWTPAFVVMILFPVAFAVAILRYRLFEIDRVISRTVSYALVAGLLAAIFAAIAVGLPQLLGLPDEQPLLVAGATLAVAALFNPLRRRIQARVDRRFNRARYDAQQEVGHFSERLRADVRLDDLAGELAGVAAKTLQPSRAAVWIRENA